MQKGVVPVETERVDKEKMILAVQAAVGVLYIILAVRSSLKAQSPKMKKVLAKQAKRIDKLNRLEYKQAKREIRRNRQ
jgi:hypothetical protein